MKHLFPACVLLLAAIGVGPVWAQGLVDTAKAQLQKQQYADCVATLAALKGTLSADALVTRGRCRASLGELTLAVADYTAALLERPGDLPALYYRGIARSLNGDIDGGIGDFDLAIASAPTFAGAYVGRATAKRLKGADNDALADLERAIALEPMNPSFLHARGCLHYDQRAWPEALADFRRAIALDPARQPLSWIRVWLVRSRIGARREATRELQDFVASKSSESWELSIASFLLGRRSESDLLKLVPADPALLRAERRTQLSFYVGARHLLDGDRAAAKRYFDLTIAGGRPSLTEFRSAAAELQDLGRAQ